MTELLVRVSFRKQVSDGNYGTEAAEITLEDSANSPLEQQSLCEDLLDQARQYVHAELGRSPSKTVRLTVALRKPEVPAPTHDPDAPTHDPEDLPF